MLHASLMLFFPLRMTEIVQPRCSPVYYSIHGNGNTVPRQYLPNVRRYQNVEWINIDENLLWRDVKGDGPKIDAPELIK